MPSATKKEKKSPKQRFLLVIGIIVFLLYLVLGLAFIFVKQIPFNLSDTGRYLFGSLLIVYSLYRFVRLSQQYSKE